MITNVKVSHQKTFLKYNTPGIFFQSEAKMLILNYLGFGYYRTQVKGTHLPHQLLVRFPDEYFNSIFILWLKKSINKNIIFHTVQVLQVRVHIDYLFSHDFEEGRI